MPIAKLSIDLEARLANLESGLKQATSLAEKSASRITAAFSGVALVFTGLASALSAGALKGIFDKYVEGAANLERLASVAGTTTENMSALAAVAKVSSTDVDQVAQMMVRLAVAISKGDDESKNAGRAFAALGISVGSLRKLDPSDQLKAVSDALSQIEKGSEKTALAIAIFGKQGALAVPYLQALADTGSLVSKISSEQGQAAKEYEINLRKLEAAQGAVAKIIVAELLPAASMFVKELVNVIQKSDGVRAAVSDLARDGSIRTWADDAAIAAARVIDVFRTLKIGIEDVSIGINLVAKTVQGIGTVSSIALGPGSLDIKHQAYELYAEGAKKDLDALVKRNEENRRAGEASSTLFTDRIKASIAGQPTDRFLAARSAINAVENPTKRKVVFPAETPPSGGRSKAIDDGQRLVEQLRDRIRNMQELTEVEKLELAIADGKYKTATAGNLELARGYAEILDAIQANKDAAAAEAEAWRERLAVLAEGARVFDATRTPMEALDIELLRLTELLDAGAISMDTFGRAASMAGENFNKIMDKVKESDDVLNEFAKSGARNIQSAFADFLFDPFKDGLSGMAQAFGNTIKRMVAEAVSADLMKRIFGDLSKGGLGTGWLSALGGLFANADGGVYNSAGLAQYSNQVVSRPTLFPFARGIGLMGEAGPEAIMPLERGAGGKLGVRASGGGGHTFNITLNGITDESDGRRAAGQISRRILSGIASAQRFI